MMKVCVYHSHHTACTHCLLCACTLRYRTAIFACLCCCTGAFAAAAACSVHWLLLLYCCACMRCCALMCCLSACFLRCALHLLCYWRLCHLPRGWSWLYMVLAGCMSLCMAWRCCAHATMLFLPPAAFATATVPRFAAALLSALPTVTAVPATLCTVCTITGALYLL